MIGSHQTEQARHRSEQFWNDVERRALVAPDVMPEIRFAWGTIRDGHGYKMFCVDLLTNERREFEYLDFVAMNAWQIEQEKRS